MIKLAELLNKYMQNGGKILQNQFDISNMTLELLKNKEENKKKYIKNVQMQSLIPLFFIRMVSLHI